MQLKPWHAFLLLIIIVLIVYYPSVHAGFNSVDDLKMVNRVAAAGPFDFQNHFFPESKRYYYRPLTTLTYYLDRDLWGGIASFIHLGNILLHLGCTLLVFAITGRICRFYSITATVPAFIAALLFALHPVNSESVCWISGRTDLLSGVFLLLSFLLLIIALQGRRYSAILFSGASLLLACLAKEVAVFALPGLLWFIVVAPDTDKTVFQRICQRWSSLLVPVLSVAGYFVMRHFAIARDTGVKTAIKGIAAAGDFDWFDKIRIAFKIYGFYFKKLFFPWPLNFGIIEIDDWYVVLGGVLLLILVWSFVRADLSGALSLISFCILCPALLVVFGKMAWTPVAERYLYIPVAFLTPLISISIYRWVARLDFEQRRYCNYALFALLLLFFSTTLHRAWIWQDNLRLYTDTVEKSPNFTAAKNELAAALMRKGRKDEAEALLVSMKKAENAAEFVNDDIKLAQQLAGKGELGEARRILVGLLDKKHKKHYALLQQLLRINDMKLGETTDPVEIRAIQEESISWLLEQQQLRPRSFTLYRIGKQYLAMGNEKKALEAFRSSMVNVKPDAHYRAAAEVFIKRLEGS